MLRRMGWVVLSLTGLVASCSSPSSPPTPPTVSSPPPPSSSPATGAAPTAPAPPRIALARGASVDLGEHGRLAVVDLVTEVIEAAPDDGEAYPAGSGVTVTIELDGKRAGLTLLSKGYTSTPVAWVRDYRIELVGTVGDVAQLTVERLTGDVAGTQTVRIARGETARLHDRVELAFLRHRRKSVSADMTSPLLVDVSYDGTNATHVLYPPREATWRWRDLRFTLGHHEYDKRMELVVDRFAVVPVVPAAATPSAP